MLATSPFVGTILAKNDASCSSTSSGFDGIRCFPGSRLSFQKVSSNHVAPYFILLLCGCMCTRSFIFCLAGILFFNVLRAQTPVFESPETALLYKSAREALSRGAVKQSIVMFQQAAQREPKQPILQRDLGQAYLLAGDKDAAIQTITPLIDQKVADELSFQIVVSAYQQSGERKKARKMIDQGLRRFSNSGMLYQELGKHYEAEGSLEYALDAWVQGINSDPAYFLNYYSAARIYGMTNKPVWAIIYGEVFVNLERETPRAYETRKLILDSYKKLFSTVRKVPIDTFEMPFERAVVYTLEQLAPVVSDGFTVDNLVMLRTRFVMDWMNGYGKKFPFALFLYHDEMLREGQFDAYNQWLFGKVENAGQFESWKKFHNAAIPNFDHWAVDNKLLMTEADAHNPRDMRGLFIKKK